MFEEKRKHTTNDLTSRIVSARRLSISTRLVLMRFNSANAFR